MGKGQPTSRPGNASLIIHLEERLELLEDLDRRLDDELQEAEDKALDALSRYKFQMFGYWAGIWVHLNRISGARKPSPFKSLVELAREMTKGEDEDFRFQNEEART